MQEAIIKIAGKFITQKDSKMHNTSNIWNKQNHFFIMCNVLVFFGLQKGITCSCLVLMF